MGSDNEARHAKQIEHFSKSKLGAFSHKFEDLFNFRVRAPMRNARILATGLINSPPPHVESLHVAGWITGRIFLRRWELIVRVNLPNSGMVVPRTLNPKP